MIPSTSQSLFERLGGEEKVRAIVDAFIDRVFADRMIGFFFRDADRMRIKEFEFQLAAKFLGADIEYQGRPLHIAHAKHPIMGGHFARRRQILKETLEECNVPEPIREGLVKAHRFPQVTHHTRSGFGLRSHRGAAES